VETILDLDEIRNPPRDPVVALGNFDGVHRGHQALIRRVVDRARARSGTAVVLTFEPHPLKVLSPGRRLQFLASLEDKTALIHDLGISQVLCLNFTPAFSRLSPEAFARTLLHERLGVKEVFVGEGFSFGKDRAGSVDDLRRLGGELGFSVTTVPTVSLDGKAVSSSRIRELLKEGRVREAAALLGRLYSLEGEVVPGSRRGTGMGVPTANLKPPEDRVVPSDGVYAAWGVIDGTLKKGVAYIGTQPTLGLRERTVELHLFDPHPDLYGKRLRIGFHDWIRGEKTFSARDALIAQIQNDIEKAKEIFLPRPSGGLLRLPEESRWPGVGAGK
jgi:riboflavin kinase/FMN adenylyltransferase